MASSSSGAAVAGGTGNNKPKPLRHVYKTGAAGCGGKAAPTAAKNSGAPLPCPFCDRIFKQDGRLKAHLTNKHADESSADGLQENGDGDNSLQADGNEVDQPQQQQSSSSSSYPIKTPKTLLHEWCQKNRRPVPKFKHVEEDGGFFCRVILPDGKKTENDVILWYRDVPTRTSQEAQHRAAIVGLHYVSGNRRLDRILAEEFRQQWHNLDAAAEKRKAYLKAHPPQLRPKQAPLPRELHSVFMSENNRRLVEGLLRASENGDDKSSDSLLGQSDGAGQSGNSHQRLGEPAEINPYWRIDKLTPTSQSKAQQAEYTWEQLESSDRGITEMKEASKERRKVTEMHVVRRKLLSLGFRADHVNRALADRHDLSSALDWLILNVPEQELPTKFAPDASKASVQVLVRGKQAGPDVPASLDQDSLSHLQEYGYALADCVAALSEASGDEDLALCILFDSAFESLRTDPGAEGMDIAELDEIREDEQLALESIYEEDVVSISVSKSLCVFEIPLPEDNAATLSMEVRIPPGSRYPLEVPVIAFRSKELPAEDLSDLTKRVVIEAEASVGRPMIYDLVNFATELGQELILKYVGPVTESISDPETSPPHLGSTELSDEELVGIGESFNLPNLRSLSKSTGNGDKVYVPPALRKLSSSTLPQSKDQLKVGAGSVQPRSQDSSKFKSTVPGVDESKESAKLKMEWEQLRKLGRHGDMWAVRSKLPAFQQRDSLLSTVNSHRVTIIAGQTGCGKSTQVPQYVLEDYIEKDKGAMCNIVCTQPRRLSAIGLADRVSKERGQSVGETVGYTVRLESNRSHRTRLLFCTTGILLRRLSSDPDLEGVTHVIVDEVHERSLDSDLLLLLLRELLKRTSTGLRLVLMSATVDTNLFLRYFKQEVELNPCIVSIPGFTYPVQEYYLEDALDLTGYKVGRNSRYAMRKKVSSSDLPALSSASESTGAVVEDMDNWESLAEDKGKEDTVAMDVYSEATIQSLSIVDQTLINYDLIELLICAILQDALPSKNTEGHRGNNHHTRESRQQPGAVLVFLPGVAEIRRLQKQLNSSSQVSASHSGGLWILALHGSLSSDEQRKVFSRPSPGHRKIVLATNIAETSVTIDDVVYVVDTGRHKEMRYDHSRGISCLEETWVSKASAKQRRGRAGRVQSGHCIRLFSRQQFQTFDDQQLPEILRVSLDGLCLKVKSFLDEKIEVAASKIITPPDLGAIRTSLKNLQDLNALDADERLTPLGLHLARMPVEARVGKMLLFGCMLRCLDPVVTIAAALSGRTPFLSPMDKRDEATAAKLRFAGTSKSDHLTIVSAYNGWLSARQEGRSAESNYCTANFLSRETLVGIEASRQDFFKILADIGFLPPDASRRMDQSPTELDSNANSIRVVKAVICAGFYPNIVRVIHPEKTYVQTEGGTVAKVAAARELRFFTKADGRVFLHPASVNFSVGKFESPWLVFSEKMRTSKVFLKDSTMVPAYGLLLFGGKVQVKHEKQAISVDDWLEFEAPARIAVLIKELRSKVNSLLFEKIERPALDISSSPVVSALIRLLTTDGF